MMNEKEILTQINKECRSFSPDNFERIKESISDNYENAEVISASAGVRFDRNIFVRFAVAAAVLFFPLSFAVKYLTAGNGGNDYELMIPAVSVTEETSQVSGKTESAVTDVTVSEKQNVSGTDVNVSDLSGTDQAAVTEVSEAVRVTAENVTQKPKGMESHAETQVRLTEAPAGVNESPVLVTEPENQITDASAEATEEPKATEAVTEAAVQTQGAGTASHGGESFTSELKPVPGFTDKIYRIKFDADMADESEKIYSVSGRNYRVKSPDAYTICIYDVIIYGYDYFDFLKKGDYVLKKEYEYTADEYFALDEQVLSMDELISSGFEAAPE
ncbi:MAG: hypothetical protein IKN85_06720 [Oscillospiraceae bacterium]|nr:hypothetical protein [Oscillospiraceae bacterium]